MNTEIESIKTINDTEVKTESPFRQLEGMVSLQPFYADDNALLFCGASEKVLPLLPANSVDLTVTSPPYDKLRTYKEFTFDFETIAKELFRVTKDGGVVVWVVGDSKIDGSESGTSFTQALKFMEIGFRLFDTMIYVKDSCPFPQEGQYNQIFEYMFVMSKGKPKTFNPITRQNNWGGLMKPMTHRQADGRLKASVLKYNKESNYGNVWLYGTGYAKSSKEKIAFEHPAIYPEQLAKDHILSWSNKGDTVLDCFNGSGTTMKAAKLLKRNSIGIEIAKEYCELTVRRINKPMPLFNGLTS